MEKPFIYIDTDISLGTPGAEMDDGAALLMLLRSQAVQIAGIGSVFGNVPVEDATCNLMRLLHMLDKKKVPVAQGAGKPLRGDMHWFEEWQAGYGTTLPFTYQAPRESAAQMIIRLVRTHPGKLTILSIGPMTNLALALQRAPDIAGNVKQVIAMGGSFGSQPQEAEFNVHCDPQAAQMVCAAGWPLTLLGLELTRQAAFSRADFAALPSTHPAVRLLKEQADGWIGRVEKMGWEKGGCSLHDAVAAAYLLRPDLFSATHANIEISAGGELPPGTTLMNSSTNPQGHSATVITQMDKKQCKELIWSFIDQLSSFQEVVHE